MQNKAILFGSLVLVSGAAFAQSAALEGIAKQAAKDKAMSVVPGASQAVQVIEQAQQLKQGVTGAPVGLKDQASEAGKDAVQQKLPAAAPTDPKGVVEPVKAGQGTAATVAPGAQAPEVKQGVTAAPAVVKEQAPEAGKDAVQQKLPAAATDLKSAVEPVKAAQGTAATAVPGAVNGVGGQAQESKPGVTAAPVAVKDQAQEAGKDAAQQKVQQAVPGEVKQGAETAKAGKDSAEQLKAKVDAVPKSPSDVVKAAKGKAKQKMAEKALGVLQ